MNDKLVITPKTKVLQLIEAYPMLEETLIELVPAFVKLKNPLLRKTVAKVATLQQASAIGNINIELLINTLRNKIGQDMIQEIDGNVYYSGGKPDWYDTQKITKELDAKPMLANGEHPVNQVIADLRNMNTGDIYLLKAPFLPAPLIDKAASLGFEHWIDKKTEADFDVFFCKI